MTANQLSSSLTQALGLKSAKPLETHLGLRTVGDLLRHYPRRYVERGQLTPFRELVFGDFATVVAQVQLSSSSQVKKGLLRTEVVIRDDSGQHLDLVFWNRPQVTRELRPDRRVCFSGQVRRWNNKNQLTNPDYLLLDDDDGTMVAEFAGDFVPIYPAAARASSQLVTRAVRHILDVVDVGDDPLPAELRARHRLMDLLKALQAIHRPIDHDELNRARQRLTWDEAFVMQVALAQRRALSIGLPGTPRPGRSGGLLAAFDAALPFSLTAGQVEIGTTLRDELSLAAPMHRLLQGEVGSGKTVVALRAMLQVVDSGGQAALLAPTEVLAQQHARSLAALLGPLGEAGRLGGSDDATSVALLTGSLGAAARRTALEAVRSGAAGLVVGTHALLSEGVEFAELGLVVVDEQHRFGVEQREALRAKGTTSPHVLVMTATPIPRTIAMTVYGDLEVSTLSELPAGRAPIESSVVPLAVKPLWIDRVWERVRAEVADGRQAFVVCARIGGEELEEPDPSAPRPATAAVDAFAELVDGPLAGLRVELLHGRLSPDDKDAVMARVVSGDVDVLVATTVIEVGVDVPNASVMVILDAERFGVSQLHQLRGRVGRGGHRGLCLLVSESPEGSVSLSRLKAIAGTNDGFVLSRLDLQQRREGDVLGVSQSGSRSSLRLLRLLDHEDLIAEARTEAAALVTADPMLHEKAALRQAVLDVFDADRADYLDKT